MMLIDTHAHLDDPAIYDQLEDVLARAAEAGVERIVNIGCDWKSSLMSVRLADKYEQVFSTVGIHPHDADTLDEQMAERLFELAQAEKVVAIGEIGLDYYHDHCPRPVQQKAFRRQIALAKELAMPITIHDRDAHGDVMRIVREERAGQNGGIFHCYSGSWEMAKECLRLGFYISFAGPVTYHNARGLLEVAQNVPLDKFLIETDSPYLSPHPYRGKTNEPARVALVAEKIAEIKGLSYETVASQARANAMAVYGLP